ncbi:hypothetical protein ACLVWU_04905 [Bdellovibrio sp. HCB290]|uniref:hypothetical protein n=1 Tax=Bdellovibrio sp. HCB290 TaxID=3394356 RepID=UPI0039B43845
MAAIQCKVEIPNLDGLKDGELTVGREFFLVCDGEFPRELQQDKLQLVLQPEQKYSLKLQSFEFRSPTQADLKVVSYTAGMPVKFDNLQLTDGTLTVDLGAVQFQLVSVLPPPQPPANPGEQPPKQEPFGPIGPLNIPVPPIYWIGLALVLGVIALFVATKIFRSVQRRKTIERLKEHDSALSPIAEFHQRLRRMQRTNTVFFGGTPNAEDVPLALDDTRHMLKLYITRRYKIPALEWSPRLILKDLKKYHPKVYQDTGNELEKLVKEFQHAIEDKAKLSKSDILNLSKRARLLVEDMERLS